MKINHTLMHYLIGGLALVIGTCAFIDAHHAKQVTVISQSGIAAAEKVGRFDWPTLGQGKTIELGEDLQSSNVNKITIYCASESCHQLSLDIDDALQIASIADSFEGDHVDSESDEGLFVGPPGEGANAVAESIEKATGISPTIVPIDGIDGVGIIIGKYKGAK